MEKLEVEYVSQKGFKRYRKIFINQYTFFIMYLLGGMPIMSFWGYLPSILTTVEKRFNVAVQDFSYVLFVGEISTFTFSLVLSYFGGPRHRPRLIAIGILLMFVAGFMMASPHLIFGSKYLGSSSDSLENMKNSVDLQKIKCISNTEEPCINETNAIEDSTIWSLFIFSLALILGNAGYGFYANLGYSFIDDNYSKKCVSILLGLVGISKYIATILGMLMASSMLKINQNPSEDPGIDYTSPQWIGAWWMGFMIVSIASFIFGIIILLFPRELKRQEVSETPTLLPTPMPFKEFPARLKKMCMNKVLIFTSLSTAFCTQSMYGLALFLPKMIEIIYEKTASDASFTVGVVNTIACIIGFGIIGILIQKLKPGPRVLQIGVIVAMLLATGISISIIFLGCDSKDIFKAVNGGGSNCKSDCNCNSFPYNPICDTSNKITYYSECHANCQFFNHSAQSKVFWNCGCLKNDTNGIELFNMEPGTCKNECEWNFYVFLTLSVIVISAWACATLVNTLISLRCVSKEDKSFAQGVLVAVTTVMGYMLPPLMYSATVDSSCTIWTDTDCGVKGYCLKYDENQFLQNVFLLAAAGWVLAAMSSLFAVLNSKKLNDRFYEDNPST